MIIDYLFCFVDTKKYLKKIKKREKTLILSMKKQKKKGKKKCTQSHFIHPSSFHFTVPKRSSCFNCYAKIEIKILTIQQ